MHFVRIGFAAEDKLAEELGVGVGRWEHSVQVLTIVVSEFQLWRHIFILNDTFRECDPVM